MPMHSFAELTRQRAFMRMWFSRLFGTTGNQMLMVAVGWQMYELTGSAWDLGLVGLYQFAPALLLTLVAGHVADRLNRAHIVAACLLTQGGVALLLVAATQGWGASSGWVSRELLLGVSVMLGVARTFQMPAQQALTPMLVPAVMLPRATALLPMFAKGIVHVGPWGLGLLRGAPAAGALLLSVALTIRCSSARRTSSANSNLAPRRRCSGRSGRWSRAASGRCWWPCSGSRAFRRSPTATA